MSVGFMAQLFVTLDPESEYETTAKPVVIAETALALMASSSSSVRPMRSPEFAMCS